MTTSVTASAMPAKTIVFVEMSPDIAAFITGRPDVKELARGKKCRVRFNGDFLDRLAMETMANVG
jgi:hypothetical protein